MESVIPCRVRSVKKGSQISNCCLEKWRVRGHERIPFGEYICVGIVSEIFDL